MKNDRKMRTWKRAKIPKPVALAFAKACKEKIEEFDLKHGTEIRARI